MNREQLEELSALHALGLLEGEELHAFERELRTNPEARAIAAGFTAAATGVAMSVEQVNPPAALKARVMAALPPRAGQKHETAPSTAVGFQWLPWAIAACLALVAGLLVKSNLALREQVGVLARQANLDAVRIAVLTSQLSEAPTANAVCVWNRETQEGFLSVAHLPPLRPDQDYQLWIVDPQNPALPVDGGVFAPGTDGEMRFAFQPRQPVSGVAAFAVSLERKGGVPKAEGPMVLLGAPQP